MSVKQDTCASRRGGSRSLACKVLYENWNEDERRDTKRLSKRIDNPVNWTPASSLTDPGVVSVSAHCPDITESVT